MVIKTFILQNGTMWKVLLIYVYNVHSFFFSAVQLRGWSSAA